MTQRTITTNLHMLIMVCLACGFALGGCASGDFESEWEERTPDPVVPKNIANGDGPRFDEGRCAYDHFDAYEPRSRFQTGPNAGECHDTLKARPIRILPVNEALSFERITGRLLIANVYHAKRYWVASIPMEKISEIYFQLEYFPAVVPAGHTQLRIDFDEPVKLYGQSTRVWGRVKQTNSLVLSAEAVPIRGDSYDLVRGAQNHFGLALRVTTLETRYQDMVVEKKHRVEQWGLLLAPEERTEILRHYLEESHRMGLDRNYHTLFRNCTTELMRVLDEVLEYSLVERVRRFMLRATEFYPNLVRGALIARGLLPFDQSTDWHELADDPSANF